MQTTIRTFFHSNIFLAELVPMSLIKWQLLHAIKKQHKRKRKQEHVGTQTTNNKRYKLIVFSNRSPLAFTPQVQIEFRK